MFMCKECSHKNVCKKRDEFEKTLNICEDFQNARNNEIYGNIYDMFQPIFDWLQKHYPSGEVFFIVKHRTAQMYQEYKVCAFDKQLKESVNEIAEKSFAK